MVLGSVVMAFEEVCPDRLDLVHKHYRKLCNTLLDIDEWGQIAVLQLLTRCWAGHVDLAAGELLPVQQQGCKATCNMRCNTQQ